MSWLWILSSLFNSGGMPYLTPMGCPNWFIIILFLLVQSLHNKFLPLWKCCRISSSRHVYCWSRHPLLFSFSPLKPRPSRPSSRQQNQEENRSARAKFCTNKLPYSGHISHPKSKSRTVWSVGFVTVRAIILKNLRERKQRKPSLFYRLIKRYNFNP